MKFLEALHKQTLFFDGAMGTQLMEMGLSLSEIPETWNVLHPEKIRSIHENYLRAGAHVIQANTFGLNHFKLEGTPYTVEALVKAALSLAHQALENVPTDIGRGFVALDIGSLGILMEPLGDLTFDNAYEAFKEVVLAGKDGSDLILIETMNDPYEMKAAVLAAKENADLPVAVTMTIDRDGRLFTGGDIKSAVCMLEGLGADVIGLNCSLGPEEMLKFVPDLIEVCSRPVLISPNAGLPEMVHGRAVYGIGPERFARLQAQIFDMGVSAMGGCCGTTPSHIRRMCELVRELPRKPAADKNLSMVSSYARAYDLSEGPLIVGERLNPTGKKKLKAALKKRDLAYLQQEALKQEGQGAHILDVNVGIPEIDETDTMCWAIKGLQRVTRLPLQIDTSDSEAMEAALRLYNGKPLINSVNGKQAVMDAVFPLVKKYGGLLVCLTLDEDGIPDTAEGRFRIAEKIVREAEKYGIGKKDLLIDTLTLTISTDPSQARVTLEALRLVKERLQVHTILGVSNVSFGLPNRELINSAFYTSALEEGLSLGIINPSSRPMQMAYDLYRTLHGLDERFETYLEKYQDPDLLKGAQENKGSASGQTSAGSDDGSLSWAVLEGLQEVASSRTRKALETQSAMDLINQQLIPALDKAGEAYEKGIFFLPQLLMSAQAAQASFAVLRESMQTAEKNTKGRVLIATVEGDIHDIGKNIVKVLLENYGFDVVDLGKDVPAETILETIRKEHIRLIGLSALMTTTIANMAKTVKMIHEADPSLKVMVGGAALTPTYAAQMGADFYSKDAIGAVRYAEEFFSGLDISPKI